MTRRGFRLDRRTPDDARSAIEDELRHHIDLSVEELVEAGWEEEAARREAVRRFGDVDETRAYCEGMQTRKAGKEGRTMWVDEITQDLRYAFRSIRKAPGYSALVVLTLAFGIAANTTTFSVMNPYLFRPLPYGEPDELVHVNQVNPITGWDMDRFSYPQYEDWRARSRAFQDVAAYSYGSVNVTGVDGPPEQIQISHVTWNMFDVLDAQPVRGRTFRREEGVPGADRVAILAHGLWERRYASDPDIVGRSLTMDGTQHTVIGVMPPAFNFPFGSARIWVPIQEDAASADRGRHAYQLVGRLKDGWTAERVRTELARIQADLSTTYPETDGRMSGVTVKPLRQALNFAWEIISALFSVLLGAVLFVLLLACVNVASLTLARGSHRLREISVRAAMGAGRERIVRQLLTESLVLALVGGGLGVAVSYGTTSVLNPVMPEDLYKVGAIDIDGVVLGFSLLVTIATAVAFGLAPALAAARVDLTTGLEEGSKGSVGLATTRGRRALVVTQVALAVVLISGAGLMLRSFRAVQAMDIGFEADRVVTTEMILPENAYASGEERRALMSAAVDAATALPGIEVASAVTWLPLNHETISSQVATPDMAGLDGQEWPLTVSNRVLPRYFETMGIELLEGRDFATTDGPGSEAVAVVSTTLAERFWPDGDAMGQSLLVGDPAEPSPVSVIGVVETIQHTDLDQSALGLQIYLPALQAAARRFFVVARTPGDPASTVSAIRTAVGAVAPSIPLDIRPMEDIVAENQLQWSISSAFLAVFGGGALLLATLGIYGLVSYSVAQRRREMGVRIALGATAGEIRRTVVGDGLRLTGIGLGLGLVAAVGLGRVIAFVLYGVSPFDPVTLGSVLVLFLAVAVLASFVPAARASTTDPITVLRAE